MNSYQRSGRQRAARKEKIMAKKPEHEGAFQVEEDADGEVHLYMVHDAVKIAERGRPDTSEAKTWIPLVPGYSVTDVGENGLLVEFEGVTLN